VFESRDYWDQIFKEVVSWMNSNLLAHEFAGLVFFEEEHPLMERESKTGTRNVVVYHT
jgi:hypothetical protein